LNNGRVRPDDPSKREGRDGSTSATPCCNESGVVRDSKDFIPYISKINQELEEILL